MQIKHGCAGFPPLQMNQSSHLNGLYLVVAMALSWAVVSLWHSELWSITNMLHLRWRSIHGHVCYAVSNCCCWREVKMCNCLLFSRPPVISVSLLTLMSRKLHLSMESSIKVWITYTHRWKCFSHAFCKDRALCSLRQLLEMTNISHLKLYRTLLCRSETALLQRAGGLGLVHGP